MNKKTEERKRKQTLYLIYTGLIMLILLALLKYLPMNVYGENILFDASAHIALACYILYFIWFFIDQNKSWRIPYFIFSLAVLIVISVYRIIDFKHNDVGLILGFLVGIVSILIPRWKEVKKKLDF